MPNPINMKSKTEIGYMREAGRLTALAHEHVRPHVKAGVNLIDLDKIVREFIWDNEAVPSFLGYEGFTAAACYSLNNEAVHGTARDIELKDGDIITVDIGVKHKNYHGDCARTHIIGEVPQSTLDFIETARIMLKMQKEMCKPGTKLLDIAFAVNDFAESKGYKVVRELGGHGVGRDLHEEPFVPNFYSKEFRNVKLKKGMVLAFEPVIAMGSGQIYKKSDNWTIATVDGSLATHEEDTLLITEDGCETLTKID